jgi:hypothetical protein
MLTIFAGGVICECYALLFYSKGLNTMRLLQTKSARSLVVFDKKKKPLLPVPQTELSANKH